MLLPKKLLMFTCVLAAVPAFAQRPFTDVTPHADRLDEYQRIEKVGYQFAYEYLVANLDERPSIYDDTPRRKLEIGGKGLLSQEVEYSPDGDSSVTEYSYMPDYQLRIVEASGEYMYKKGYLYNAKGRLDTIVIASADAEDRIAKYNKDGTVSEFLVRRTDVARDESGEMVEPAQIIHFPWQKITYTYDKNKRPVEEKIFSIENELRFNRLFTYDDKGRITKITYKNNDSPMVETFSYDAKGNLTVRIFEDATGAKEVFKYLYQ